MILGTASYMSPEQAKGRATDARSDIWAFGCVLYEMLAGKRAFAGDTVVEILGAILKSEPDWRALPPETPPAVVSLLKRCLQKDRSRRMRDIADARFQIEEAAGEAPAPAASSVPPRRSRERLAWIAATFALVSVAAVSIGYPRRATTAAPEMRLEIVTPPGADLAGFAMSPDGRALVFQATVEGKNQLWLRPLDSEAARPLAGTEGAAFPFWSPEQRVGGVLCRRAVEAHRRGDRFRAEPGGGAAEHPRWCVERRGHHPLYSLRHRTAVSRTSRWREGRGRHRGHRTTPGPPVPAVPARWPSTFCSSRSARPRARASTWVRWTRGRPRVCSMRIRRRYSRRRTTCCSRDKGRCWPSKSTSTRASPSAIRCRWRGRSRLRRGLLGASRCRPHRPDPSPTAPKGPPPAAMGGSDRAPDCAPWRSRPRRSKLRSAVPRRAHGRGLSDGQRERRRVAAGDRA